MINKIFTVLKKIKLRTIIILILILAFNTYAWFIYATKVSMELNVHVSSWNVEFTTGDGETITNILIEVERIYPGMENFEKTIDVHNKGETRATLNYNIKSLKVLDQTYIVTEGSGITSDEIYEKMETEYPFKIKIEKDDTNLLNGTGSGLFKITVEWPFESGDDELDTLWGNKAYEYYSLNPGQKSILLNIELIATQQQV